MKKVLCLILSALMALSIFTANVTALAATSTEYDYNLLSDGTAELTKYNKSQAVVNIPTEISKNILGFGDKIKVSKVADTCFNNCTSITEIGIPNGIAINAKSVNGCTALKQMYGLDSGNSYSNSSVVTKDNTLFKVCAGAGYTKLDLTGRRIVTIGSYAFCDNTKLTTIVLPASCKKIASNAFYNCPNLKAILYQGNSMDEFNSIKVGSGNDVFKKAKVTVHYDRAHSYVIVSVTQATLTKNGKIYKKCAYCGKKISKTIYYPKTIKLSRTKYVYDGKVKKPTVTVKNSNGKKIAAKHYKVTYSKGRKNVGKYAVKVQFNGNYYKGTKKFTFVINPKATKITKATTTKNSFTVKYNKVKNCTGYQVQYATDSKFKNGKKTYSVSGTSKKIANLKSGKTYYVRVRAYKTVKNKKYFSAWTATKSVALISLTNKQAKQLYVKAEKVATDWLFTDAGCAYLSDNYNDSIYIGESSNSRVSSYATPIVHKSINSTAKLKKHLSNYFDSSVYNYIVNTCYRDINGKLYFVAGWGIGSEWDYKLKSVQVISQTGNTAKVRIKIAEIPLFDTHAKTTTVTRTLRLKRKNGKWLFEDPFYILTFGAKIK